MEIAVLNEKRHYGTHMMNLKTTNEIIKKLTGTLPNRLKEKYSDSILIQEPIYNYKFALYCCFGEWRIGSVTKEFFGEISNHYEEIARQLKKFIESQK